MNQGGWRDTKKKKKKIRVETIRIKAEIVNKDSLLNTLLVCILHLGVGKSSYFLGKPRLKWASHF